MKEASAHTETIEQKQAMVSGWIKNISETQKVREIDTGILREVLVSYGADFENLTKNEDEGLGMYNEKKRKDGMEKIWGGKFKAYQNWINDIYIPNYKERTGKGLPKMENVPDIKNEDREASGKENVGMISFLCDITAYASENLSGKDFKRLMEARAKNGVLGEIPKKERGGRKKEIIEWDREIDPEKGPLTKDPRPSRIREGEFIPEDKQEIRPASFRPGFPVDAWGWISGDRKIN